MALSNILKEPRREITETVIGVILIVPLLIGDYLFAVWFDAATTYKYSDGSPDHLFGIPGGLLMGLLAELAIVIAFIGVHYLGQAFCDWIENNTRVRLRPARGK